MSKKTIDEKNISRAFSTLKDYQKNRIVKAISEYLAINERNANTTFESFISDTISGQTLAHSEREYGIDHATAWRWRHKIMEAFSALEDPILLGKSAEVDGRLFPLRKKLFRKMQKKNPDLSGP